MRRLTLLVPILITGCVSVSSTRLGQPVELPPVPRDQVVVYHKESDIPQAYDKVALVYARANTSRTHEAGLVEAARKKAAELGANGLVVDEFDATNVVQQVSADFPLSVGSVERARFLAVRTH